MSNSCCFVFMCACVWACTGVCALCVCAWREKGKKGKRREKSVGRGLGLLSSCLSLNSCTTVPFYSRNRLLHYNSNDKRLYLGTGCFSVDLSIIKCYRNSLLSSRARKINGTWKLILEQEVSATWNYFRMPIRQFAQQFAQINISVLGKWSEFLRRISCKYLLWLDKSAISQVDAVKRVF